MTAKRNPKPATKLPAKVAAALAKPRVRPATVEERIQHAYAQGVAVGNRVTEHRLRESAALDADMAVLREFEGMVRNHELPDNTILTGAWPKVPDQVMSILISLGFLRSVARVVRRRLLSPRPETDTSDNTKAQSITFADTSSAT